MKRRKFNDRELNAYLFIENFILSKKYSPSFQEIIDNTDYKSKASVYSFLRKMKEKNIINFVDRQSRTISINNLIIKIDKRKKK